MEDKRKRRARRRRTRAIFTAFLFAITAVGLIFVCGLLYGFVSNEEKADTAQPVVQNDVPIADEKAEREALVQGIMKKMSLSDMVYQMMFVTPESITNVQTVVAAGDQTKAALQRYPVGGIIYFAPNLQNREQTMQMIANTQAYSKIPLFISVDEEGGRVSRLGSNPAMGTTKHPPMREIGDTGDFESAYNIGCVLGEELSALGFNVDFAPDADVIIADRNTEIGDRSFGTNPEVVSGMVANVVHGMQENGVSATLKHFPGHGSTYVDSHTGYSASSRTIEQLRASEFLSFRAGMDAGADFVMISHMTLVKATEEKVPSSISKEVITDMLLGELGYEGIVITDSFSMGAITREYTVAAAAIQAIHAGVDMILMPTNLVSAHDAIVQAVEDGRIPKQRIEQSVKKILMLKAEKGMLNLQEE